MTWQAVFENALLILGVQVLPLVIGYRLKVIGIAKEAWGRPLAKFIILTLETAIGLLAAWRLEIDWAIMSRMLPIALISGLFMTGVGWAIGRMHSQERPDQGGYILATGISNFGFTMAGFVCLLVAGEHGRDALSIQSIYIAPYTLLIFLFWFPLGRNFGAAQALGFGALLREGVRGLFELTSLPLYAMFLGLGLHAVHVPYWAPLEPAINYVVYADTFLSMFCVGITLQLGSLFQFRAQTLTMGASKFLVAPVVGLGLAYLFGIHGLHLQVVLICSSVPVGLFSTFAASLFGLNRNLTNALLILTTGFYLLVVLPLLFWLLPLLN